MKPISGIGKESRMRLSELMRRTSGTLSVGQASEILGLPADKAAKLLAWWADKGWLSRLQRGLYIFVPLEARSSDIALEDPWIVADRLFSPCYIGGWSAAEYWELTEQISRTILIFTKRYIPNRRPVIKGTNFRVRTISAKAFFGMQTVWRGQVKVNVSDPSRTVLDMFNDPSLGGGLRPSVDTLRQYMASKNKRLELLMNYAERLGNGAVFKRLGFILERLFPEEGDAIAVCRARMTKGKAKLDPSLAADKLVTAWQLWVPSAWATKGLKMETTD
jgi:predicted transcriptional regulator of viral defense system